MNKKRKGYIDLDDIKKINSSLSNLFTEEDLEVLVDIIAKTDSKITFENFMDFLNNEN